MKISEDKLSMVVHNYNPNTDEIEKGGSKQSESCLNYKERS
jgi:hypothetical protein